MSDARAELVRQAQVMRGIGSPFVADVLEAAERHLDLAPLTAGIVDGWEGNGAADALAMRLNAALHALARQRKDTALDALYSLRVGPFDGAIAAALRDNDAFVAEWLAAPPQTNEVGRAAAFYAALMTLARRYALPFDLLELGSSAGLNLNLARYAYDLGGVRTGTDGSPVRIAPEWRGATPLSAPVSIASAHGVDLHPLDAGDAHDCARLAAYILADQPERGRRLHAALDLARAHPPHVTRADAANWLRGQLARPQPWRHQRVVFHSMVLQYLAAHDRAEVERSIRGSGERAAEDAPLAWIAFEWDAARSRVELFMTTWPGGKRELLAICHPYGAWIDWVGAND